MKLLLSLSTVIVFWNVENFFDYREGTHPQAKEWNAGRFYRKAKGIGKTILQLADSTGTPPQIVALAEIDGPKTLQAIVYSSVLRPFGYRYIHYDSHDPRGIDCALLYRDCKVKSSRPVPITIGRDTLPTRDFLLVKFDSLAVLVCHLPSKRGGSKAAAKRRGRAMYMLDSIAGASQIPIIVTGDFNETANESGPAENLVEIPALNAPGTIRYLGKWEQIDRVMSTNPNIVDSVKVEALKSLSTQDTKYGGIKPLRTFSGPRYLGGISDHYPIAIFTGRNLN